MDAARGNRGAAHTVKSVTPRYEITLDLVRFIVLGEADLRLARFEIVDADIRHFEQQRSACALTRGDQVLHDFILSVDGDSPACQLYEVDVMTLSENIDVDAVVRHAL